MLRGHVKEPCYESCGKFKFVNRLMHKTDVITIEKTNFEPSILKNADRDLGLLA